MSSSSECQRCGNYIYHGPVICDRCIEKVKAEAELAKWTRKHDNIDLQGLCEQTAGSYSLAAHAAYIHGLEVHLRQAEARIKELEQELSWVAEACEKAETELVQLREELKVRIYQRDTHSKQTGDFIDQNKKLEANNHHLQERVKQLEEKLQIARGDYANTTQQSIMAGEEKR